MSDSSAPIADTGESFSVEFENDIDDALAFHEHYMNTSPNFRRSNRRLLLLFPLGLGVMIVLRFANGSGISQGLISEVVIWAVVCAGYYAFFRWWRRRSVIRFGRRQLNEGANLNYFARQSLTLSKEGVSSVSSHSKSLVKWTGVERLATTPNHLFIYHTSASATIIPRRAFADSRAFDQFAAAAEWFHRAVCPGLCRKCGYDLLHNTSGKCPECGTAKMHLAD